MTLLSGKSHIFQDEEVLVIQHERQESLCRLMLCSAFHYCLYAFLNIERIVYLKCHTLQAIHYLQRTSQEQVIILIYCCRLVIDPLS